jgi:hypothetical protein
MDFLSSLAILKRITELISWKSTLHWVFTGAENRFGEKEELESYGG